MGPQDIYESRQFAATCTLLEGTPVRPVFGFAHDAFVQLSLDEE
jgi:hypothetical protein